MLQRDCDICRSPKRQLLHEQRFTTFDNAAGLLAGYDVVACDECGFLYADGLPEPAVFERYYRDMSKHEPPVDDDVTLTPYRQHNVDLIAGQVARRLPRRDACLLDVGIGSGETLLALRRLGYSDLTGLDPSPRTTALVGQRHGLRILNTPISHLRSVTERFDVILLSGVLEHLRDLGPTLALLRSLLREQGCMCVAVPDAGRFWRNAAAPFQYFSVEHINFFTRSSLQSLMAMAGLELRECWDSTALLGVFEEPIVHGVFGLTCKTSAVLPDRDGASRVARYVERSERYQAALVATIEPLACSGEPVLIWGAGSLTMHLLSDSRFARLNIKAFVDANAHYWNKTIGGRPILPPAAVAGRTETVLIVSFSYETEIRAEIRDRYRLENRVLGLFAPGSTASNPDARELQYG